MFDLFEMLGTLMVRLLIFKSGSQKNLIY